MGKSGLARAVVVEVSKEEIQKAPLRNNHSPPADPGPLYAAALLKLALELRRTEPRPLEETIGRILEGTAVDREEFRAYLRRNFSLLRRA
jgi:hypothetical protein